VDQVVALLRKKPAMAASRDASGRTPLHVAAEEGHVGVLRVLVGADHRDLFIAQRGSVDVTDADGWTPLTYSAREGRVEATRLLLGAGASHRARTLRGWSPLLFAADQGHVAAARVLLEAGADVLESTPRGWTPMHLAAWNDHVDMLRQLALFGGDSDALDDTACGFSAGTPLRWFPPSMVPDCAFGRGPAGVPAEGGR